MGLRFVVYRPVPGASQRRRVDILLCGPRIAVFVDGCFWYFCPDRAHLSKTNTTWWRRKFRGIARRDRDTDSRLTSAGWLVFRVSEHEDPFQTAQRIKRRGQDRLRLKGDSAHIPGRLDPPRT